VDGAGYVYVADTRNNRIQKLDAQTGAPVASWGALGTGSARFSSPAGLAVDRVGNLYVADSLDNRVLKLAPDGSLLFQWGGDQGTGSGQLRLPRGVAVDAGGNVYVADADNHRVQEFAPDGTFLARWGRCSDAARCRFPIRGSNPGEFFYPRALVADGLGDVYVADTGNDRVQRLVPRWVIPTESTPEPQSDGAPPDQELP
jgi:DNA-binding beta-propeller fold protein YncE